MTRETNLRARLTAGEAVVGTFLKTPAPQFVEIAASAGLDFVVADREHAPIDLSMLDTMAIAARAWRLPLLFRSQSVCADAVSPGLDLGCSGVMAPHVCTGEMAAALVAASRFGKNARSCSPSVRAADYGTMGIAEFRLRSDEETLVVAQIEDSEALDRLDEIAATPGIDVLFLGPVDLAQSIGCTPGSPAIAEAAERVVVAAKTHGLAAGCFVGNASSVGTSRRRGMQFIVSGSDQSLARAGMSLLAGALREDKETQ